GRPPARTRALNTPPRPSAITIAWATSASAWARRPAPSARATAEATPPPIPPADIVCISMTSGNVTEIPARASGPRRPTKYASSTLMATWASSMITLGAASRNRVSAIGPSSRRRVVVSARRRSLMACYFIVTSFSVKTSYTGAMPKRYGQACPVARTLEVVGDRWTLLLVRDLLDGPKRFQDFARRQTGIAPNILSDRLKLMEEHRLVTRH